MCPTFLLSINYQAIRGNTVLTYRLHRTPAEDHMCLMYRPVLILQSPLEALLYVILRLIYEKFPPSNKKYYLANLQILYYEYYANRLYIPGLTRSFSTISWPPELERVRLGRCAAIATPMEHQKLFYLITGKNGQFSLCYSSISEQRMLSIYLCNLEF